MDLTPAVIFLYWWAATSLVGFVAMGLDKLLATGGHRRISERTLWLISLAGGFLGLVLGGFGFHHKTSKAGFWVPVAVTIVLWAALLWAVTSL